MKKLLSVSAENYVVMKEVKLPLNRWPLMVIRGLNHDRKSKKAANAVGKSLLAGIIPTVRFAKPPAVTTKGRGNAAKKMFAKGSQLSLEFETEGNHYLFQQYIKGEALAYRIIENGKDLGFRKSADAAAKMSKLWPVTEEQFYAFNYIDVKRGSVLLTGRPDDRFNFFKNVFNLGAYDMIYKEINRMWSQVRVDAQQLKTYESEYHSRRKHLRFSREQFADMKHELEQRQNRMSVLQDKLTKCYEAISEIDQKLALVKGLTPQELAVDIRALEQHRQQFQHDLDETRDMLDQAVRQEQTRKNSQRLRDRLAAIRDAVKEVDMPMGELPYTREQLQERLDKAQDWLHDHSDLTAADWQAIPDNLSVEDRSRFRKFTIDDADERLAECEATKNQLTLLIANWRKIIGHAAEHRSNSCPFCRQQLPLAKAQENVERLEKELRNNRSYIGRLGNLKRWLQNKQYIEQLPFPSFEDFQEQKKRVTHNVKRTSDAIKWLDEKARKQRQLVGLKNEYNALVDQLKQMAADADEIRMGSPETYRDLENDVLNNLRKIDNLLQRRRAIGDIDVARLTARRQVLQANIAGLTKTHDQDRQRVQKLTVAVAETNVVLADLKRLREHVELLRGRTKNAAALECLREAFSQKGIQRVKIAALTEMFTANLNRYANLIFGEKIYFQAAVGENSFDILATRNDGKTSDVQLLSTSESKAFMLLSMLAILPFIPDAYRTNLVVLDEIESGLDDVSRRLFVDEFLPMLGKVIPNIVIITPLSEKEFYIPNAKTVVVEKRKGWSTLNFGDEKWSQPSSGSPRAIRSNSQTTSLAPISAKRGGASRAPSPSP